MITEAKFGPLLAGAHSAHYTGVYKKSKNLWSCNPEPRTLVSKPRVVSSTFWIVQILVYSHFDLVSWLLALEATKQVPELAVELINIHL